MIGHRVLCGGLLIGALGCAAPVARGSDDQVEGQAEAVNYQPDFEIGVVAVKYAGSSCNPCKSTQAWTEPISDGTNTSGETLFTNGLLNPDGPRIGLMNNAPGTLPTIDADFRLTLKVWDVNNASSLNGPSTIVRSGWASEGGGFVPPTVGSNVLIPDRFQVGIETRPWPASAPQSLYDFRVGLLQCKFAIGFCDTQNELFTSWMGGLKNAGNTSWTQTTSTAQGSWTMIDLEVSLQ